MLIKYIKSVLWRVAKCLSYIEEARCLKVNTDVRLIWSLNTIALRIYSGGNSSLYTVNLRAGGHNRVDVLLYHDIDFGP